MPHFRKKPVVIEAEQFNGGIPELLALHCLAPGQPAPVWTAQWTDDTYHVYLNTWGGRIEVHRDDWIVKNEIGEFSSLPPDTFESMYEPVDDEPWGVYHSTCPRCDLPIANVIEVELVRSGEIDPSITLCQECEQAVGSMNQGRRYERV